MTGVNNLGRRYLQRYADVTNFISELHGLVRVFGHYEVAPAQRQCNKRKRDS